VRTRVAAVSMEPTIMGIIIYGSLLW
jgi:hypothetical protein